jgi:Bacterial PH domain
MKRFLSTKNTFTVIILWGLVLFLSTLLYLNFKKENITFLPLILLSIVIAMIIWVLLDTRYVIKNEKLLYRSGPFRGNIEIKKIEKIQQFAGYNVPVTMKPALNYKGYIITFDKNHEVYVSPKNHSDFINELLKINKNIIVS